MDEHELWNEISSRGESVRYQYGSDMFMLLAAILAYYKVRGTEPQGMLSEELLRAVSAFAECAALEPPNKGII